MSRNIDPVEKVIETLWFSLFVNANMGKPFFYAVLDGIAEQKYGDAFSLLGKGKVHFVKVYEFKRSLSSYHVGKERSKYRRFQSIPNELFAYSQQGHFLVSLKSSQEDFSIQLDFNDYDKTISAFSYLHHLFAPQPLSVSVKNTLTAQGVGLGEAMVYFEVLAKLKKSDTGGGESPFTDERQLLGVFADDTGRLVIASAATYLTMQQLLRLAAERNREIDMVEDRTLKQEPSYGPSL